MNGARILVVDDDRDLLHLISIRLRAEGYEVLLAESGEQALLSFREHRPQLVVTDLRMGEMDGLALFSHLQAEAPTVPVIILTAHGSIPEAVSASQKGVFSFLSKPFDGQELLHLVSAAVGISPVLDPTHESAQWRRNLLTASVRMEGLLRQALRISEENCNALVIGPSGSGKTTLIRAIHQAGKRASAPFVTLASSDYPAAELETALLPEVNNGVFSQAKKGVLHIKDVGALSPLAQSRLFSVLFVQKQARDPLRLPLAKAKSGGVPDVQVIASNPRPLDRAVAEGAFRSDLFYLLGGATLQIPPLSERSEDIPILAAHFLSEISPETRITLTADALRALQKARWPGNIGQLKSALEQIVALTLTSSIPAALVKKVIREYDEESIPAIDDARREFERDYLVRLLQTTVGNVARAARLAQRNRTEFYKLLARHGLNPVNFKQKFE
jgi:two-component system response regulator GlrR